MTSFLASSSKRAFLILGLLALCFHSSYAHTYLSSVVLNNGSPLAEGDCVRPHPLGGYDSPIPFLNQSEMTCGWSPALTTAANRKCPITAGQTISLQWHHQSAASGDDIIDPSHNGPIIVYLAKSDTGSGNVWFKIYEDGFANGQWAVQRLLANGGRVDIPLPSDIAPGNYLLRGELLALHGAYALNGVQPYVGCVELTIAGTGTKNPAGVAFPGYYTQTDPGMLFSIYQPFTTYIIPGPPKYVSGSSTSGSSSSGSSSSNTVAPTAAATTKPTSAPTTNPTTKPTNPTSAPATSAPTTAPTNAPASGASNIKVGLNSGSTAWWVGVVVSGGGETTVKVEMTDSGSFSNWVTLTDKSYAFVYEAPSVLKAPLTIRLTSSTGKQVVLSNIFSSFSSGNTLIDSGKSYSSGSSGTTAPTTKPTSAPATVAPTTKPTSAPATVAPTTKPTSAPATAAPTTGNAKINVYPDSSQWWFAVTISGTTESISKIELKDNGSRTSYQALTNAGWAYTFTTNGVALVTPLTVKVTTASGKVTYATLSNITPGASIDTTSQ